jgi:hypothetical protein
MVVTRGDRLTLIHMSTSCSSVAHVANDDPGRERVERFFAQADAGEALLLAMAYLRTVGASVADAGETWGLTVLPDTGKALLRVNARDQQVLVLSREKDRGTTLYVATPTPVAPNAHGVVAIRRGLGKTADNAGIRFDSVASARSALRVAAIARQACTLFDALTERRLLNKGWHNETAGDVIAPLIR